MKAIQRIGLRIFSLFARRGSIDVALPDGTNRVFGEGQPSASIDVQDYSAVGDILRRGLTGFTEAYMDGRVTTPDLPRLLAWGVANGDRLFDSAAVRATVPIRRVWQRIRPDRRHEKVRSMNDHYNLGNDFYASWLDESMTYSSARFADPDQDLYDAQQNKYRAIADHAGLRPGMKVLEIGCGWGGFAEYAAAQRGCEVVGVTLSEEQARFARKRMSDAGLADRVTIEIKDFRDVEGTYDAIVSIEMIESVDETHWQPLFDVIQRSLSKDALAVMQVITIVDDEWERYRSRADFIQQYIFPGGQIPAPKILRGLATSSGLEVEQVETFGLDYARTLSLWRQRFEKAWPDLEEEHGLDERFHRMWDLYLSLCEAGFRMGRINIEQWVFSG